MRGFVIAASAAVLVSAAAPAALAEEAKASPGLYANLGYANADTADLNLQAVTGRLGWRFNDWLGVEAEVAGGVKGDSATRETGVVVLPASTFTAKLSSAEALYAVGFWPVAPGWDLLGRVGYGHVRAKGTATGEASFFRFTVDEDSWNYGLGAQYHWDGVNGVRADYTRQDLGNRILDHADVWSIAYSRRF